MHLLRLRQLSFVTIIAMLICCADGQASDDAPVTKQNRLRHLKLYRSRQSDTDLAITGLVAGLPSGATGYVHYDDLLALPLVTVALQGDENFPEPDHQHIAHVAGVYLESVASALGVSKESDLIAADCLDNYHSHFPNSYIAAHHPILGLTIDHLSALAWAKKTQRSSLGPYFVTNSRFVPAFKVLSHADQPQLPTNIIRLDFTTTAATFGAIVPRGNFAPGSPQQQGFIIASQNCLRCHNQGPYGGNKSGRNWQTLGTWAREQPAYFTNYVHNPKAFEANAKMPGNPQYDAQTLAAITAYFQTFADSDAQSSRHN